MKTRQQIATVLLAASGFLIACSLVRAQEQPPVDAKGAAPAAAPQPGQAENLVVEQGQIADRFKKLEDALLRMAELTAAEDPRRAELLRKAVDHSKGVHIATQLDDIAKLLEKEQLFQATKGQAEAQQNLLKLLELLLSEDRSQRLESEKERIRNYLARINRIIKEEKDLQGQTHGTGDPKGLAPKQGSIAEKTAELAKEMQRAQGDNASDSQGNKGDGSQSDNQEGKENKDANKDAKSADQKSADQKNTDKQSTEKNNAEKNNAEKNGSDSKSGAQGDSKSENQGSKSDGKSSDTQGDQSDKQSKDGAKQDQQSGKQADKQDNKSGDQRAQKQDPKDGAKQDNKDSKNAENQNARKQDQGRQRPGNQSPDGKPSDNQKGQQNDPNGQPSDSQSQNQQQKSQGQSQGNPSEGQDQPQDQQQDQEQGDQPPQSDSGETQARKRIQNAEQRMQEAKKKLEEARRNEAVDKQEQALRALEEAKAELEQILRQLREEEIERTLAKLEARFRKMLEMQTEVYEGTKRVDATPEIERDRDSEVEAGRLSRSEALIVVEADKALTLMKEEGSSVAFPEAVVQMREDMQKVTDRLGSGNTGKLTQALEEDVIKALEEMIAALKKAQKDAQQRKMNMMPMPSSESGPPQDDPLVDKIAELKMIKTLQLRVNTRHERYSKLVEGEQAKEPELVDALQGLKEREQRIHRTTRDIVVGRNK